MKLGASVRKLSRARNVAPLCGAARALPATIIMAANDQILPTND